MTTILIGIACLMIGGTFGVIIMALLSANKQPVYDLDGVVAYINNCANPRKAVYLIIRRVCGEDHHIHRNPPRKLRAIA